MGKVDHNGILQQIIETLPYAIFWKDKDLNYLGCNTFFAKLAGFDNPSKIVGLSDYDLPWSKSESDNFRVDDREVMQTRKPKLHIIEPQRISSGQNTWVDTSKVPLLDSSGNVYGILGIYADITKQKSFEEELRKTKDYLIQAIEAMSTGFVIYDKNHKLVMCNQNYKNIYSEVKESLVPGVHYVEVLAEYAKNKPNLLEKGEDPKEWAKKRLEQHVKFKEKDYIQNLPDKTIKVSDRYSESGDIVSIRTDITELQKQSEELAFAKKKAEESLEAKSQFMANMSHEIRTPMNGVIGMTELLVDTSLSSQQADYVKAIKDSSNALLGVLNDILDYSKIESKKLELYIEPFSISDLISEVSKTFTAPIRQKKLNVVLAVDDSIKNAWVNGDVGRLRQVLNNIFGNSVKFTLEDGWIVLQVKEISRTEKEVSLKISITDTGVGIPDTAHDKIFEPFVQADQSITRRFGGTGLGLSICKELTNLMGGELSFNSAKSIGTVFYFEIRLPLVERVLKNEVSFDSAITFVNKNVLVVEDNLINQKLLYKILQKYGLQIKLADNGLEALELIENNKIDLIFTDIQMPIMGGMELTRILRENQNLQVPIVAITAHALKGDRETFMNSGMDGYISKPISKKNIVKILEEFLS